MATIVATIAGADSNCYLELEDADAYFANLLTGATWAAYSEDDRTLALITATHDVECLRLTGSPYDVTTPQALHFPRDNDYNEAEELEIPQAVQWAVCEQALWLLQQRDMPELVDRRALQSQGVKSMAADGISETYGGKMASGFGATAEMLISPYKLRGARIVPRDADYY